MPLLHRNVSKDAREASVCGTLAVRRDSSAHSDTAGWHVTSLRSIATGSTTSMPLAGDAAAIGDGLDPRAPGGVEGRAIGRIDVAGEREAPGRADLDQEQHHRAAPGRHHVAELAEVLGAALGHGVGKFGEARAGASGGRS